MNINGLYARACENTNMGAHVPRLYELAKQCNHVTEFGTREGVSTIGLLYASPRKLFTYDIVRCPEVNILEEFGAVFRKKNVWDSDCNIEETDMLFTDTIHDYRYLKRELSLHAGKVRKFIAIHDTGSSGEFGNNWTGGLTAAIEEFLWEGEFEEMAFYDDCCGMTVLGRK